MLFDNLTLSLFDQTLFDTLTLSLFDQTLFDNLTLSLFDQTLFDTLTLSLFDQTLFDLVIIGAFVSLATTLELKQTVCCVPCMLEHFSSINLRNTTNPITQSRVRLPERWGTPQHLYCMAVCTGVGERLHTLSSHRVLGKPQGFSRGTLTN